MGEQADVQRPAPPLTEEELARLDEAIWSGSIHASSKRMAVATLSRLIADLRAARARVKELEAQIAATKAPTRWENRSRGW